MRESVRRHPVVAYVVLACALSWAWWLPMLVAGAVARPGDGWPTHLPGLLGPALACVAVTALVDGRPGLADLWRRTTRWRVGWGWWLLVVGTAALALLGVLVPLASGEEVPSWSAFTRYTGIADIGLLGAVIYALVVNGFGEEIGWRGFAVDRLIDAHGLTRTSLMVTGSWAVWHVPLFLIVESFRGFGVAGSVGWLVGLTAGSLVLTRLYLSTGRSIALVAAWHTAFNLTSATDATAGAAAAVSSTLVMVAAAWIVLVDLRGGPGSVRSTGAG